MDSVARDLASWLAPMPAVDGDIEAARQRIGRLSRLLTRVLEDVAADQGISVGDWEALAVLRRAGHSCTPTAIATELGLTSGTVSTRLRRLTRAGLISEVAVADGRSHPVQLTPAGERAWRAATAARVEREAELFAALDEADVRDLNASLATLLERFETAFGAASVHDRTR